MAALCCYFHHHVRVPLPKISGVICNKTAAYHDTTHCAFAKTKGGMSTSRNRTSCGAMNLDISSNRTDDGGEEVLQLRCYPPIRENKTKSQRRELLLQLAAGLFTLPLASEAPLAIAGKSSALIQDVADDDAPQQSRLYLDDVNKFKILIPPDWQVGSGEGDGIRSLTAFYPQDSSATSNVSLVITGLGADFTRLESFGKVDAFAETLVGGLDRSWQRPPGVAAKLVDSKSANGLYYIEYTLQNPGESRKHLFSVLGISNNGWYNRLYTLTGQYIEEEAEKYGPTIEKAVASFRLM